MQTSICVDDFGNEVFRCHWTNKLVSIADAVITGGFMPGVKSKFIAVKDHREAKKASHAAFNAMDANCNTCKHLQRVPHDRAPDGFLHGRCTANSQQPKPYAMAGDVMKFHPDDWMGMDCWENR